MAWSIEAKERAKARTPNDGFLRAMHPKGQKHPVDCAHCAMMRERGREFGAKADKTNLQLGRQRYWEQNPRPITSLERKLDWLLGEFPDRQREVFFAPYTVDFYIPSLHLAFEADGSFHEIYPARDKARDAWLLRKYQLPVVRFNRTDLRVVS